MIEKQLSLTIADIDTLHSHYMPMIKDGGIFIPTVETLAFHERASVQLLLEFEKRKVLIPGIVVWIAPEGARGGSGVGLRFTGDQKDKVKKYLETHLISKLHKIPATIVY